MSDPDPSDTDPSVCKHIETESVREQKVGVSTHAHLAVWWMIISLDLSVTMWSKTWGTLKQRSGIPDRAHIAVLLVEEPTEKCLARTDETSDPYR